MDGYSEAEIIAARGAASYMGWIESPESADVFGERANDDSVQFQLEPGTTMKLAPGEKFNMNAPSRPNTGIEAFMRMMLREMAAGLGLSYEALSRDYSQSNYSSSRLALLDERDVWKSLQLWFIRSFRYRLHREFLQAAILSKSLPEISPLAYGLDPKAIERVYFRPRGWQWIDPTKEVQAYKEAVKAGFITVGQVISQTAGGDDLEDVLDARKAELEFMQEQGLAFDTSPDVYVPAESRGQVLMGKDGKPEPAAVVSAQALSDAGLSAGNQAPGAPGAPGVQGAAPAQTSPVATEDPEQDGTVDANADEEDRGARRRVVNFARS